MNYYFAVLSKYATFTGRARRSEFWYFMLFNMIISIALAIVDRALNMAFLNTIYSLAVFLPSLAVSVRRLHDVNKSGWFYLVPFYNLYLFCIDGTSGENAYGEDPKGRAGFGAGDYQRPTDVVA
jgi:uncharacterized membrane protein YhaH (DUF805 family)